MRKKSKNRSLVSNHSVKRRIRHCNCYIAESLQNPFSATLYVDNLVEESELVERQAGAALGTRSRLAARVAAPPLALSPNGCKGRKSRIARRGKPR
jgi:hypothetical protein